jgi:hypothetical protein
MTLVATAKNSGTSELSTEESRIRLVKTASGLIVDLNIVVLGSKPMGSGFGGWFSLCRSDSQRLLGIGITGEAAWQEGECLYKTRLNDMLIIASF